MSNPWYRFSLVADAPDTVELYIHGLIAPSDPWGMGEVVSGKDLLNELAGLAPAVRTIRVRINSRGGDAFTAVAIANALREHGTKGRTVETFVDGIAASAASLVLMAGSRRVVADNALVMIHNPRAAIEGDAAAHRKVADTLDQVRTAILATYRWHVTDELSDDELAAMLDAETWFDAEEALLYGFASEVTEGLRAAACLAPEDVAGLVAPERYADRLRALVTAPKPAAAAATSAVSAAAPAPPASVLAACIEARLDAEFAMRLVNQGVSVGDLAQLVSAEAETRARETRRADDIRALCRRFEVSALAEELVSARVSLESAQALVGKVVGLRDGGAPEIDGGLSADEPGAGRRRRAGLNVVDFYAQRNAPK